MEVSPMTIQQRQTEASQDRRGERGVPLYLLGSEQKSPVECSTRWMDDRHAYVVAPLATARMAGQEWDVVTSPGKPGRKAPKERRHAQLVAADALLGPDSGKEGLLLRFFEPGSGAGG